MVLLSGVSERETKRETREREREGAGDVSF